MPIAWRRWGELPQPSLRVSSVTISLLLGPLPPSSQPPSHPRMLKGSKGSAPPKHSLKLAKAGWALTASLPAPCILAVLWEAGIELLIWEGKHRAVRGRAVSVAVPPKPPAGRGLREHPTATVINPRLNCGEWEGRKSQIVF